MPKMPSAPHTVNLHQSNPGGSAAYQSKLANIDATTSTADNVLTVFGDWRKVLGILLLILVIFVAYRLFRSTIKSTAKSVWDTLAKPFRDAEAVDEIDDRVSRETGEQASQYDLTPDQALACADALYGCISMWGDDEQGFLAVLKRYIRSTRDWELVVQQYGVREYTKYTGIWFPTFSGNLENTITDNFSADERKVFRSTLIAQGVNPSFIHF